MTINKNFKSRPEKLKYSECMNFSLSGLDLKLLFMVTGAYYKSGLYPSSIDNSITESHKRVHKAHTIASRCKISPLVLCGLAIAPLTGNFLKNLC